MDAQILSHSPHTTGVIFKIERETFRVIDQSGAILLKRPAEISNKVNSRLSVATDHDNLNISAGDEMIEVDDGRGVSFYRHSSSSLLVLMLE